LIFVEPDSSDVRIYFGAPPNTPVTTVRAIDENDRQQPQLGNPVVVLNNNTSRPDYSLYAGKDHNYFRINSENGEVQ
jgi:hypothetical protein